MKPVAGVVYQVSMKPVSPSYTNSVSDNKREIKMAVIRDYNKLASDILREVGGEENISNFSRCATRLRLVLNQTPDTAKANI